MPRVGERSDRIPEHGAVAHPYDVGREVRGPLEGLLAEELVGTQEVLDHVQADRLVGRHLQLEHDRRVRRQASAPHGSPYS